MGKVRFERVKYIKVVYKLKPMDSFGTWRKLKLIYIFLLMQNFIELYELLMPC